MFDNLPTYYNELFSADLPEFPDEDFEVTIRIITPSGTIKNNLNNIIPKRRWFDYTNEALKTYGYQFKSFNSTTLSKSR